MGRDIPALIAVATLVLVMAAVLGEPTNVFIKTSPSWTGTMHLPDGTKKLVGSFSELERGPGHRMELENHDARLTLYLEGLTVHPAIDLDLTTLSVMAVNKDQFIGIPAPVWTRLEEQLHPLQTVVYFPKTVDAVFTCTKAEPANCTRTDWLPCTDCKLTARGWRLPGPGSYGTSQNSAVPTDIVKKADELLKWKEIIAAMLALGGVGYGTLRLAKRKTLGEERVEVHREIGLDGGKVKLSLRILNHSTFAIRKVRIELDLPEHLKVQEPSVVPLEIGDIEAEEAQNVVFHLLPIERITGSIRGKITYLNHKDERTTVAIKDVPVPCLCSFMVKTEIPEEVFDEKREHMDAVKRRRTTAREREVVIAKLSQRCSVLSPIAEQDGEDGSWEGKYFAKERNSDRDFGLLVTYTPPDSEGAKATVDITAFGENTDTITGLADEIAAFVAFEDQAR